MEVTTFVAPAGVVVAFPIVGIPCVIGRSSSHRAARQRFLEVILAGCAREQHSRERKKRSF